MKNEKLKKPGISEEVEVLYIPVPPSRSPLRVRQRGKAIRIPRPVVVIDFPLFALRFTIHVNIEGLSSFSFFGICSETRGEGVFVFGFNHTFLLQTLAKEIALRLKHDGKKGGSIEI